MSENFFTPFGDAAAMVAGGIADLLGVGPRPLADPPRTATLTLPDDLFAKPDVQTEWWYYTGHCVSASGRRFGFELCFFKRRTDGDKLAGIPLTVLGNPMYFAHFAISDIDRQDFRYEHIRSFGRVLDHPASASAVACDVRIKDWSLREVAGRHVLHATLDDGLAFDAILEPAKPLVLNGDNGSGIAVKGDGASVHFSYTRMKVDGTLTDRGRSEGFTGTAWMDREFGSWQHGVWDWFSIQFDDDTELMIYQFRYENGELGDSTGTYVAGDGTPVYLKRSDFEIENKAYWQSPRNGAVYPSKWNVRIEKLGIDIEIASLVPDQELDTRGTTMVVYWEGACGVNGRKGETDVTGKAYVELVGYDMSHRDVGLADFLFGPSFVELRRQLGA
jgi:predicted secreted hydrolase